MISKPIENLQTQKRILFVDDDILILESLQQTLRPLRNEWTMEFVTSGQEALKKMEQNPFDVVISDLRMPVMNGAELLNEVMKRHPRTVRLVLSGDPDQTLVMKCVGSTHQYLMKPCGAETLKNTINLACAIGALLKSEKIISLASQIDALPSLPSLYLQLLQLLQNPKASIEQVATIIAQDVGMTARILRLVNSAFFGLRMRVSSPLEAVSYLGLDTIKSLVLSIQLFTQFNSTKIKGFSFESLLNHSVEVAVNARLIAHHETYDYKVMDECFLAGMLHDIGKLVFASKFQGRYAQTLELARMRRMEIVEAEQEVFSVTHADMGSYLLGLWGVLMPVVEAVALHHYPSGSFSQNFSPLTAVHAANALSHEQQKDPRAPLKIDPDYLAKIGLSDRVNTWRHALRHQTKQRE